MYMEDSGEIRVLYSNNNKPSPPLTADDIKFNLLKDVYYSYVYYSKIGNKPNKTKTNLCRISSLLSDNLNGRADIKKMGEKYFDTREYELLYEVDAHYPTFRSIQFSYEWIIPPGSFTELVQKINTECENKLTTPVINKHLLERNKILDVLKQPREIYYEPKIESENTDALHIDDIRLDEPDAGADAGANAAQENDASKRPSFSSRFLNLFKSKRVYPTGGNSRKSRKKTKSRKCRKTTRRK